MTGGLYFPCVARQRFSDQLRLSDVDWRHKDSKWPQSRHWGNLTLTRHTKSFVGCFLDWPKEYFLGQVIYVWLGISGRYLFPTFVRFPTKTFWSHLSFSAEVSTFLWILERSNLQKLFCATVLIKFAIFLEKKNKSKFPVRSKVRRNGQAGTGLER